jgi:hypothetical protein
VKHNEKYTNNNYFQITVLLVLEHYGNSLRRDGVVLDCCGWATPNTGVVRVNSKAERCSHFFSFFIGHYRMYKQPIDGVVLDCCGWATPNTGVVRVNSKGERCSHFFHSSSVTIGCISSQSRNISKFQHILHSRDVLHTAL